MERRKLLQALIAIPASIITKQGKDVGRLYKIEQDSKYIVFLNPHNVSLESFCINTKVLPPDTPVICVSDGDMDNAIRIYRVE